MLGLMASGGVAFIFALLTTPVLLRFLRQRSLGQRIREDGPATHRAKEGTPTMGGVVIVAATVLGYVLAHATTVVKFTRAGELVIAVLVFSGALGFADDYVAIRNTRNLGLNKRGKFAGQLSVAVLFAILSITWVHTSTTLSFTRFSLPGWQLGALGWVVMAIFILVATSNAVNFTDGADGLAA